MVLTEDNRNRKSSCAPCPVGLNQHVLGLATDCDVRNGRNDETEPKSPRDAGKKASPARPPKVKNFCAESARKESQSDPVPEESGTREFFSSS